VTLNVYRNWVLKFDIEIRILFEIKKFGIYLFRKGFESITGCGLASNSTRISAFGQKEIRFGREMAV